MKENLEMWRNIEFLEKTKEKIRKIENLGEKKRIEKGKGKREIGREKWAVIPLKPIHENHKKKKKKKKRWKPSK